jgi:hypothetical protein
VRAAERARVLAAVGGIDPSNRTTCATPPRGANGVSADASIQPLLRECPKRAVERVDTHLLLGGSANAHALSGYSETAIQKMGRWKGATFKEYIREELANYADGMSTAMKTKFNFMNVAGNAFRDITETVLTMEYNTEFNTIGAA